MVLEIFLGSKLHEGGNDAPRIRESLLSGIISLLARRGMGHTYI